MVCQFSNSTDVAFGDRLYPATPFRWLGSLNTKHPGDLTAGNARPLNALAQFVRRHFFDLHRPPGPWL
jgi:hypothetical protein